MGFDLAAKWQQKRWGMSANEGWFILTNLGSLPVAIEAYKTRFGIEEAMQRCLPKTALHRFLRLSKIFSKVYPKMITRF
ncbi:MAG: hypothetical protein F6K10_12050 [Moorea sp. SIO2B7]|uniref:hypothetical protein n=1 Tax=Moorena sp. SIO1G6 TaxID=2607840 RepID=UPI001424BEAA|nr:hypothetical protein [Moorena sp. SIO1G6]NES82068.1 hypothetical protein [Moorena sp. SIO2B7]